MINLFVANCVNASNGEWLTLPMEDCALVEMLERCSNLYGETIISDYEITEPSLKTFPICQYDDVQNINNILKKSMDYIALYIVSDGDSAFADKFEANGRYLFFPSVKNQEELGEAVVSKGLLGYIPPSLLDAGYIDFEKVGIDFECNGIRLFDGLGAIGEISEFDFNKWFAVL